MWLLMASVLCHFFGIFAVFVVLWLFSIFILSLVFCVFFLNLGFGYWFRTSHTQNNDFNCLNLMCVCVICIGGFSGDNSRESGIAKSLRDNKVLRWQNQGIAFMNTLLMSSVMTPMDRGRLLATPNQSYLPLWNTDKTFAESEKIYSEMLTRTMNGDPLLQRTMQDNVWASMMEEKTILIEDMMYVGLCAFIFVL